MRLLEAVQMYWLDKKLSFSETSIPRYELTFRRLVAFLDDPQIEQVSTNDLRRFLAWLPEQYKLSKRTVSDCWVHLSSLWTWASVELEIPHIIRGKIKQPPYSEKKIAPFTLAEIKRLIKGVTLLTYHRKGKVFQARHNWGARDLAIVLVLLDSGLRASELCALTLADYDPQRGRLHVAHGKGDKERYAIIGQRAKKAVLRYLLTRPDAQPADPLFVTKNGTPITRTELRHQLRRAGDRAGVPGVTVHRFRHTMAITFLRNGGSIAVLRELLGHESLEMVLHYARIAEIDIDAAAKFSPADIWKL